MIKKIFIITLFLLTNHNIYAQDNVNTINNEQDSVMEERIEIINPWLEPSYGSVNSKLYMTLKNNTDNDITLTAIIAPDTANNIILKQNIYHNENTNKIIELDHYVIPANSEIEFDGHNLFPLLSGLKKHIKQGEVHRVILRFKELEGKTLDVTVKTLDEARQDSFNKGTNSHDASSPTDGS